MTDLDGPRRIRRVLGVDFGDTRTGLAATDWTGSIVVPLDPIVGRSDHDCAAAILAVAAERETEAVVVGVPLGRDGQDTERTKRTRRFVAELERQAAAVADSGRALTVHTEDESWTTDEAHARLKAAGLKAAKRKKLADSVAAMIVLERFRDRG